MKSILTAFLLVLVTMVSVAQQSDRASLVYRDSACFDFGRIAEQWMTAYNGPDADALTPLYAEEARYISGHVSGLVAEGRDQVIANFRRGMKMGGHLDGIEVLSINHSCDLATILCTYDANNSGQKVSGRTLLVLQKTNGLWRIILQMTVV